MGNGIIIRVPQGMELSLQLLDALAKRFPGYVLEVYNKEPDYQRSITRRVESLHKAFLFLFEAYPCSQKDAPFTKELAQSYLNDCKAAFLAKTSSLKDLDALEIELKAFSTSVRGTVSVLWNEPAETATRLLNEAEQYVLMAKGRDNLVTLMSVKADQETDECEYILQIDTTLSPCYDELLQELKQIKNDKYPKTPSWFRALSAPENHFMQAYFCNLKSEDINCIQDFGQFLTYWTDVKKQAKNIQEDLVLIAKDRDSVPSWFNELPVHQQEMFRVLAKPPVTIEQIDKNLLSLNRVINRQEYRDTLAEVTRIPQWYWVLPLHQQCFLEHVLKTKETIEEAVASPPSRLRTLPLPANFGTHVLEKINSKLNFIPFYEPKYRSSHVSSRDALEWPAAVQLRHVVSNLRKVLENAKKNQLIAVHTLITPLSIGGDLTPDYRLDELLRAAIKKVKNQFDIYYINHPLNYGQYLPDIATNGQAPYRAAFLAKMEEFNKIERLVEDYKSALGVFNLSKELFLSSLVQLLVLAVNGYPYGSCVSNKDRKAVEIMHTNAMVLYNDRYNEWPKLADAPGSVERTHFVSIVADLYITRHHHVHAGQNAPGAEGIKTPSMYFPADIVAEINKRIGPNSTTNDDRIATFNEVKKIPTEKDSINHVFCQLTTRKLGEAACTRLYTSLYALVNESNLFIPKEKNKEWVPKLFKPLQPNGIVKIKNLMETPEAGSNNVMRLAGILAIVKSRPEEDESRSDATNSVYNGIRKILDQSVDEIEAIATEWDNLFKASKREMAHSSVRFE